MMHMVDTKIGRNHLQWCISYLQGWVFIYLAFRDAVWLLVLCLCYTLFLQTKVLTLDYLFARDLPSTVADHFGKLDVLMIASGIGFHGVALDTPMEEMARVTPTLMNVNLLGPMLLTRGCLPMMLSEHPDRCANVCSQGCGHNIL